MVMSLALSKSARDLCADQAVSGATGSVMADGTDLGRRVSRYGMWRGRVAESLVYGSRSAADAVMQFLIDDGVAGRPNRAKILDSAFTVVGVSCGPHKAYGNVTSVLYADQYVDGTSPAAAKQADAVAPVAGTRVTESASKDAYVADLGPIGAPVSCITLVKKGPFVVMRTKKEGELSEQRWRLPFATSAAAIAAKCVDGKLVLSIVKQLVSDEARKVAVGVVDAHKMPAKSNAAQESRPAVKLGPNTADRITATVEACAVESVVHVRLGQEEAARTNVVFDFEFKETGTDATGTFTRAIKSG
jgi:hypothetical protein